MKKLATAGLIFGWLAWACGSIHEVNVEHAGSHAAQDDEDEGDEAEEVVTLDQIPQVVKDAAIAAVPGLVIEEAERESDGAGLHYCVHGRVDGKFTEVEVAPDGKVLGVEADDDGGDEDDD